MRSTVPWSDPQNMGSYDMAYIGLNHGLERPLRFQNRLIRIFFFDTFFMNTCEFGDFDFVTIVKGVKASVGESRVSKSSAMHIHTT